MNISGMASKQRFYCIVFSSVPWKLQKRGRNLCCWPEFNNMLVKVLEKLLPFAEYVLADQCCLVSWPYYSARPMCFGSRGPSEGWQRTSQHLKIVFWGGGDSGLDIGSRQMLY